MGLGGAVCQTRSAPQESLKRATVHSPHGHTRGNTQCMTANDELQLSDAMFRWDCEGVTPGFLLERVWPGLFRLGSFTCRLRAIIIVRLWRERKGVEANLGSSRASDRVSRVMNPQLWLSRLLPGTKKTECWPNSQRHVDLVSLECVASVCACVCV